MADNSSDSVAWYHEQLAQKVIGQLKKNNIQGFYVKTEEEARDKVLSMIPVGSRVSHGGSLTLEQIGLLQALRSGNYDYIDRRKAGVSNEEQHRLRKDSLFADVFLMSTNALTIDGKLVNIDRYGNRVAALIYGPPKVFVVAGINKIVSNMDAAIRRIKDYVSPIHAKRRNWPLPCAETGHCVDCQSPERICCAVVTVEFQPQKDRISVIIVGKELGL